jgi:predicted N-acetyltransferase YhbS
VGHIGFSPLTVDGTKCGWLQMAPVSVEPDLHHQGIGSALIKTGLARLKAQAICGVGVVGNPAYYERFGFAVLPGLAPDGAEAEYFRAMVWVEPAPQGVVRYASAFSG